MHYIICGFEQLETLTLYKSIQYDRYCMIFIRYKICELHNEIFKSFHKCIIDLYNFLHMEGQVSFLVFEL